MYMYMWHAHVACIAYYRLARLGAGKSVRGFLALNAISNVGLIGDRWNSAMIGMQAVEAMA